MMATSRLLLLSAILTVVSCDRILVIPTQGRSHMISTNSIGQELKLRGHEVRPNCLLSVYYF